jgi:hypothetical protein
LCQTLCVAVDYLQRRFRKRASIVLRMENRETRQKSLHPLRRSNARRCKSKPNRPRSRFEAAEYVSLTATARKGAVRARERAQAFLRGCTAGATPRGGTLQNSLLRRSAPGMAGLDRRRLPVWPGRCIVTTNHEWSVLWFAGDSGRLCWVGFSRC